MGPSATIVSLHAVGYRLWDIESRQPIGNLVDTESRIRRVQTLDGEAIATAGEFGSLVVWDLDVAAWLDAVCPIVNRNMTADEWDRFVPGHGYRETCPDAAG